MKQVDFIVSDFVELLTSQTLEGIIKSVEIQNLLRVESEYKLNLLKREYVSLFIDHNRIKKFIGTKPYLKKRDSSEIVDLIYNFDVMQLNSICSIRVIAESSKVNLNLNSRVETTKKGKKRIVVSNSQAESAENPLEVTLELKINS